jgi:hypothetical protein
LRSILIVLVLVVLAAAGTLLRSTGQPPREVGAVLDGTSSALRIRASASAGSSPVGSATHAPVDLLPGQDEQRTGSVIEGWVAVIGERLQVAPLPTAVDRSALLDAADRARSCRTLPTATDRVVATFMVDQLPGELITVLAVEPLDRSETAAAELQLGPMGALLVDGATPIRVEPGRWYRWTVELEDRGASSRLQQLDGSALGAPGAGSAPGRRLGVCVSTVAPTRIYLDEVTAVPR